MSRHRLFRNEIKKKINPDNFSRKSKSVEVGSGPGIKLGTISFSTEMLTYKTLSGEFEYISGCFDSLSSGVSGLSSDFYALSTDVLTLTDELSGKIGFDDLIIEKTWEQLMDMKTNSNLVPGQQYRITDYVATVANDSNARSANHPFDLIVVADSENKLNEKARAIRHTGDTYFPASVKFEAWQVWYCLDNDTNRFSWADAANGKGVIYRLIDEWRNDCPYDFKGIQFARWELSNPVGYVFDNNAYEYVEDMEGKLTSFLNVKSGLYGLSKSDGSWVFGYDSVAGMDRFKIDYTVSENHTYLFTFGSSDYSMSGTRVRENVIRPIFVNGKLALNNIVFLNTSNSNCFSNVFGSGCSSNTFGDGCYSNTFGDDCQSNTFGSDCYYNSFGDVYQSNTFGNSCYYNTFGNDIQSNTLGSSCYSNTFCDYCSYNTLGAYCYYNTFGNDYQSNTLGSSCYYNTFGDGCYSNTLCDYCSYNTFSAYCSYNVFGNDCCYNTFGNDCQSNTFGNYCSSITFGSECRSNTFGDDPLTPRSYFRYITFEPGVNNVRFDCPTTSDSDYCQNITIAKGINATVIQVLGVNQVFKTTYQANGSQTIDV